MLSALLPTPHTLVGRVPTAPAVDNFLLDLASLLPEGWEASLRFEDSLTRVLEEAAGTRGVRGNRASVLLALAPTPENLRRESDAALLASFGWRECRVVPIPDERPFGQLLLLAGDGAAPLTDTELGEVRERIALFRAPLKEAHREREKEKLHRRLRRVGEGEIAERFLRVAFDLLPDVEAAAVLLEADGRLQVARVERRGSGLLPSYLGRTFPAASPAALRQPGEGDPFASLIEEVGAARLETVVLETVALRGDGVDGEADGPAPSLGRLLLFHLAETPAEGEARSVECLSRGLTAALEGLHGATPEMLLPTPLAASFRESEDPSAALLRRVLEEAVRTYHREGGMERSESLGEPEAPARPGTPPEPPTPAPDGWFWEHVHAPWKERKLTAEELETFLRTQLAATGGYYTRVAERLGVSKADYRRFMDFLSHTGVKPDYRPYRA